MTHRRPTYDLVLMPGGDLMGCLFPLPYQARDKTYDWNRAAVLTDVLFPATPEVSL